MAKKVLLLSPYDPPGREFTREGRCEERRDSIGVVKPPLTLALLASLLDQRNIPYYLIENTQVPDAVRRLGQVKFDPDFIILPTNTPTIRRDIEYAEEIRKEIGGRLVAFGPHTSGVPTETLEKLEALNVAIIGEPEYTVMELIDPAVSLESIQGIAYRNSQNDIVVNQPGGGVESLDDLPFPAWHHLDLSRYRLPLFRKPFLLLELSRGCPFNCSFCVARIIHGKKIASKSPARALEEIKHLMNRYGVSWFYFWGDTVILNQDSVKELCELIIAEGVQCQWIANARPEALQDLSFVKLLRKSGCRMLSIGVESSDAEICAAMKKKLDVDIMKNSVRLLRQAGIYSFLFLVLGYPGEKQRTAEENYELALELDPDFVNFYPVVPFPGTPLWQHCVENNLLYTKEWDRMDYNDYILRHPSYSDGEVLRLVRQYRLKFYLRPKYMLRKFPHLLIPGHLVDIFTLFPQYLRQ